MSNINNLPKRNELEAELLKAAAECPNCKHKLFYVTSKGIVCYKCKTVSVPE